MLETVEAIVFVRFLSSGRTRPALCICRRKTGERVEVVVKLPGGCDSGAVSLCREVIGACLAGDLGLPVPEPFWVVVPEGLIPGLLETSDLVAFGSRHVGSQFHSWHSGLRLNAATVQVAASIVAFDGIIQNFDRRRENANCLVCGDDIRIIDHEGSFIYGRDAGVLGWLPPWQVGGMNSYANSLNHIFADHLKPDQVNFDEIELSWRNISDDMLTEYSEAIHQIYQQDAQIMIHVDRALYLIREARDNIQGCMAELRRVLS